MRKILLSLMALLLVMGLVTTGIVADFWDIETSDDNCFEAGILDLKVSADWEQLVAGEYTSGYESATDQECVWNFNVSQIEPCDWGNVTFDLVNVGCLPGFLSINVTEYVEGPGMDSEPECKAEGLVWDCDTETCSQPCDANLDEQLEILLWQDDDANRKYDAGEQILLDGLVTDVLNQVVDTNILAGYLLQPAPPKGENNTKYLGFWWHVVEEDPDEGSIQDDYPYGAYVAPDNDIMSDWVCFDIEFILVKAKGVAGPWELDNKVHDPDGDINVPIDICVDATNTGSAPGSTTLSLDIVSVGGGGGGSYHAEKPASAGGGDTTNVCFTWTPTVADDYTITISCTDDSIGPNPFTATTPPVTLVPPSWWDHEVVFSGVTTCGAYTDTTIWKSTLIALGVSAVDSSPCLPVPLTPPNMCAQIDVDHGNLGVGSPGLPQRKPSSCPAPLTYDATTLWASFIHGGEQSYRMIDAWLFGSPLRQEWAYGNYTLLSGTNIGKPYVVGNSWNYSVYSAAMPGYPMGSCLSTWHWYFEANVVASGVSVTVPAGTFTDCYQIDVYCDWDMDCAFDKSGNPALDELTERHFWSPTTQCNVKSTDYLTFIDHCQIAGTCVSQGVCTGGTCGAPIGPPVDKTEVKELIAGHLYWSDGSDNPI